MAIFRVQLANGEKRMKTDLKAQNEESARAILEMSPLVRTGMFEIDTIVPLRPYEGFAGSR